MSSIGTMTRKAFKKLGLSISDLVVSALAHSNGKVDATAYEFFWAMMSQPEDEKQKGKGKIETLAEFVVYLLEYVTKQLKKNTGDKEVFQVIFNTICYIALNYSLKGSAQLWEAIKDLQDQHSSSGRPFVACDDALKMLSKSLDDGFTIEGLVIRVSTLLPSEELQKMHNILEFPSYDGLKVIGGESMCIYSHLRASILSSDDMKTVNERIRYIIESILQNMPALSKTFKISPELSSVQLRAYMFMMRVFLVKWTAPDTDLVEKALETLEGFVSWPRPSSDAVMDVMNILKNEVRSKGYSVIEMFLKESRLAQLNFKKNVNGSEETAWSQPLFMFMDSSSSRSAGLFRVMRMRQLEGELDSKTLEDHFVRGLNPFTQLQIIYHVVRANVSISSDELVVILKQLDFAQLSELFFGLCIIAFESAGISGKFTEKEKRKVTKDYEAFLQLLRQSGNVETENPSVSLKDVSLPPVLPEISYIALLENLDDHLLAKSKKSTASFPRTKFGLILEEIIVKHVQASEEGDPVVVRIGIAGSDRLLHSVVCGYLNLYESRPEIFDQVLVEWLIVPLEDNKVSSFIARHDAWYKNHVFLPFRQNPPFIPWIDVPSPVYFKEDSEPIGPGLMYREIIDSYAREASHQFNLTLHHLFCWDDEIQHNRKVIPFFGRVEVSVQCFVIKQRFSTGDRRTDDEILRDKTLHLRKIPLYCKLLKTSMISGQVSNAITFSVPLERVVLSNIPVHEDVCFPANPVDNIIEFYGKTLQDGKRRPVQPEMKCSVKAVEITCVDKSEGFLILVDGQVYGPFWRVLYALNDEATKEAAFDEPNFQIEHLPSIKHIPVQTFFPITL